MSAHVVMNDKPFPKGYLGGECNRTACKHQEPSWWSSVERAYYCADCAIEINKWCPSGVARLVNIGSHFDEPRADRPQPLPAHSAGDSTEA